MSTGDIQKAKMRALFMQGNYGKTGSSSNGTNSRKTESSIKPSNTPSGNLFPASKVPLQPKIVEHKKPVMISSKISDKHEGPLDPKLNMDSKEPLGELCRRVQIPWQTPQKVAFRPFSWSLRTANHGHRASGEEGEKIFRLGLAADNWLGCWKSFDSVVSGLLTGHGKFESLGALGISCMLLATAGGIAWHAVDLLLGLLFASPEAVNHSLTYEHVHSHSHRHGGHHQGIDMDHPILALSMTIVSISIKEGLYWITKRAGERQGSGLMKANAWHHRADAISSVVALIGVGGSILGVKFLDPLAGLVVSGMIVKAGLETGYHSVLELVDAAIPAEHLDPIKQTILQVEGVKGCHCLRGRRAGSNLHLDVHIEVDPFSSVSAAHGIGEKVRQEIHKSYPEIAEVFIHIDPSFLHFSPNVMGWQDNVEGTTNNRNVSLEDRDIGLIVSNLSRFPEKMEVERITRHFLQGKILLEVEVSMPPDILIRDAIEVAEAVKKEILRAASDIIQVRIQLRLGQPISKFAVKM
ncbi:hypothetical protein GH714_023988 [Hevea brasiliensis]|uniref:Uncharacterized protein n=1 Tax=Hevea brasiliensis TaxID=3981 RepID=A0A6A6LAU3_HEVBR|nr:hypothetical protein GH714_023988 [Hevea brasiliensis]